jgi:four helix bundle protein
MKYEEKPEDALVLNDAERRDLRERTKEYALGIIRLYVSLPKEAVSQVLGKQIRRSGTSVGANYREAHRSRSTPEFLSKVGDCLKELEETACWLELLRDGTAQAADKLARLLDETEQLLAIFTSIAKKVKAQLGQPHPS